MSLVIAGERSGVGKTTVTLALLAYLRQCNLQVQSFKVGPDYIDPMFHTYVTGRPCRNLDPVLTSPVYVQQCFTRHTQTVTHALVEGVMGLFDGASPEISQDKQNGQLIDSHFASPAHIARLLDLPVLLVVDCGRMSASIAALVHGYRTFDPRVKLAGVVLNRVGSDRHLALLQSALDDIHVPILGVLHRQDGITIPDRHLGLVPTAELDNLQPLIDQLAHLGKTCFDWSQLMPLLQIEQSGQVDLTPTVQHQVNVRLAIADDAAFSFYYQDNLDLLADLGAELLYWSPLTDTKLPTGTQGLYLGGGFPEMFAAQLAENRSACHAVSGAIQSGLPTYAECGGLMYLCQQITDFDGRSHPMVGVLPTTAVMGQRLTLGYRHVRALQSGVVLPEGAIAWGHEFHRSHLTTTSPQPLYTLQNGTAPRKSLANQAILSSTPAEGWHLPHLHASYIHLHWGATPDFPQRFLRHCEGRQTAK